MTGYHSVEYATSLGEFGQPLRLSRCDGWLLQRDIPESSRQDGMGCYPLFTCSNWGELNADLQDVGSRLISVSLVADPFSPLTVDELQQCFDFVRPFKEHFVVDVETFSESQISKHHRYYARKALAGIAVDLVPSPVSYTEEWTGFYETLIARHSLTGIKAFSRASFAAQLSAPGLVMFRARGSAGSVGAHLWFIQNGVAYSHLAAFNDAGYATGAAYALYWEAIRTFQEQMRDAVRSIDLGAGAGTNSASNDGLTKFKRGWTSSTRTKYFCGRVFDKSAYASLAENRGVSDTAYFPAYRVGEF